MGTLTSSCSSRPFFFISGNSHEEFLNWSSCIQADPSYFILKESAMKKRKEKAVEQPAPFTPGVTRAMVRQHAFELYRDKLPNHPLTVEDWVLAEKDLVNSLEADNLPK
jgi:hypothetical protein